MANVVSMAKSSCRLNRYVIFSSMSLLACMDAVSGLNGERLFANSSEFTNWLHFSISGRSAYDAVVFPAPLHPDITYKLGISALVNP